MSKPVIAAIEAGGTKFICAVGTPEGEIIARDRIATTSPSETLGLAMDFFRKHAATTGSLSAAGIASFGPLDLDPSSSTSGSIVSTPKPGWSGVNIREVVRQALGVPTILDTDVNCAALAEGRFGAARDCNSHCYMTVGTGIGVGVIIDNKPIAGRGHPEIGHMRVPRAPGDTFEGRCPYHLDCVEGLASGPAIEDRWGEKAENLPDDHPAWEMEAHYVAALCNNLIYTVRPERIVIGGGVFERKTLYARVRRHLSEMLADYALSPSEQNLEQLISPPELVETPPGLLGALELARITQGIRSEAGHVG